MSGIKRRIEDKDPDYEDISVVHQNKRHKVLEHNGNNSVICSLYMSHHSTCTFLYLDYIISVVSFFPFYIFCLTAREATVQKIEAIIKDQFSLEMKNKEHEIEVIGQVGNTLLKMHIFCIMLFS